MRPSSPAKEKKICMPFLYCIAWRRLLALLEIMISVCRVGRVCTEMGFSSHPAANINWVKKQWFYCHRNLSYEVHILQMKILLETWFPRVARKLMETLPTQQHSPTWIQLKHLDVCFDARGFKWNHQKQVYNACTTSKQYLRFLGLTRGLHSTGTFHWTQKPFTAPSSFNGKLSFVSALDWLNYTAYYPSCEWQCSRQALHVAEILCVNGDE